MHVDALERLAGLARGQHRGAQHHGRGEVEVGRLRDDHRVLAAELQEGGDESARRRLGDEAPGADAAGEAHDVDLAHQRGGREGVIEEISGDDEHIHVRGKGEVHHAREGRLQLLALLAASRPQKPEGGSQVHVRGMQNP